MRFVVFLLSLAMMPCVVLSAEESTPIYVVPDALHTSTNLAELESFASACEAQEAYDHAATALQRALTLAPTDTALRVRLAENQYKVGEAGKVNAFSNADAVANDLAAPAEIRLRAQLLRGLLYLEQDLPQLASADFGAVLAVEPEHARAAIGMAATEVYAARVFDASQRLDALGNAIQGYDVETRYLLRWALQHFEQRRHVFPDEPKHHAAYGKLLYRAGRLPDALLALRRAASMSKGDTELWNLVAAIASQLGSAAEASAACEASLKINPEQPEIRALVDSMKTE